MKKLISTLSTVFILSVSYQSPVFADHSNHWFNKENIGRAVGTGLGAYLGSKVGKGRGNDAAIAAGAVGGYILGGKVGREWYGQHQNYGKKHTKRHHYKHVKRTSRKGHLYPVQTMPKLEHIDAVYSANRHSNVRGGPGTKYVVVDGLRSGEEVRVLGRVVDRNWFMIARNDIITGFVHMSLLEPAGNYYSYVD